MSANNHRSGYYRTSEYLSLKKKVSTKLEVIDVSKIHSRLQLSHLLKHSLYYLLRRDQLDNITPETSRIDSQNIINISKRLSKLVERRPRESGELYNIKGINLYNPRSQVKVADLKELIKEYLSQDESELISKEAQENLRKSVQVGQPLVTYVQSSKVSPTSSSLVMALSSAFSFFGSSKKGGEEKVNSKNVEMKEF